MFLSKQITFRLMTAICLTTGAIALEKLEADHSLPVPYQMNLLRAKRQFGDNDPSLQQSIQNLQAQQQNGQFFGQQSSGQQSSGSGQFPSWNNPNQGGFGSGNFNQNAQDIIRPQTTQRPLANMIANHNTVNEAECIRNCPATNQWNPVCGTDNVSYGNANKLRCAQQCGRQVALVYQGTCVTTPAPNKK